MSTSSQSPTDWITKKYNARFTKVDFDALERTLVLAVPADSPHASVREAAILTCSSLAGKHYQYGDLAAALLLEHIYEQTPSKFSEAMARIEHALDPAFYAIVQANAERLDEMVVHERDGLLSYFGLRTLQNGYLLGNSAGVPAERPQHMFLRVALSIHMDELERAQETYDLMSTKKFVHATPTLFNAGTRTPQLSSCFLVQMQSDSVDGIFSTLADCARISKYAGGIGLSTHNVRAKGALIKSTNQRSSGIIPMLRIFNNAARYVNQGGKRNGSIAVYLEPWHSDVMDFLELRKNYGHEEMRTRDLFTALWIPDMFMRRVRDGGVWSLMTPDVCKGLNEVYGEEFDKLFESYEERGMFMRQVPAREVWDRIIESQLETGMPFMLYKDSVNRKSNQQHLGTIQCGNLCTEIVQYSSKEEVAVCNLASIGLPAFVSDGAFDFAGLHDVTRVVTRNLDKVIVRNMYPVDQAHLSNMQHRPIGVGVQGLADVFAELGIPFDSDRAAALNVEIFETMYHAAVTESVALAERLGPHPTFPGSPAAEGRFQFDLWGVQASERYDWETLRQRMMKHGLRNSLMIAPMPTASTSQILGYNECFEPFTSNLYKRNTLAGEFIVVNRQLVKALEDRGCWNEDIREQILIANGSVLGVAGIPEEVQKVFKTAWEIKQRVLLDMAADRGPFVCQSQSLNLFMADTSSSRLSAMHMHGWQRGLKTGMYYLRTKPKASAQQFTLDPSKVRASATLPVVEAPVCTRDAGCVMCSA